jgi:hypothetical protein
MAICVYDNDVLSPGSVRLPYHRPCDLHVLDEAHHDDVLSSLHVGADTHRNLCVSLQAVVRPHVLARSPTIAALVQRISAIALTCLKSMALDRDVARRRPTTRYRLSSCGTRDVRLMEGGCVMTMPSPAHRLALRTS